MILRTITTLFLVTYVSCQSTEDKADLASGAEPASAVSEPMVDEEETSSLEMRQYVRMNSQVNNREVNLKISPDYRVGLVTGRLEAMGREMIAHNCNDPELMKDGATSAVSATGPVEKASSEAVCSPVYRSLNAPLGQTVCAIVCANKTRSGKRNFKNTELVVKTDPETYTTEALRAKNCKSLGKKLVGSLHFPDVDRPEVVFFMCAN